MKKHLFIIYFAIVLLTAIILFGRGQDKELQKVETRLTRVEFFQEATRLRDNLVGFKQVNASLANNTERAKSCEDSKDLLTEWSEDVKKFQANYSSFINSNEDAKNYFDSITKLNDTIGIDCTKFVGEK